MRLAMRHLVLLAILLSLPQNTVVADSPIHVLVWDEQQPRQKEAYEDFLGNAITDYLSKQDGLNVRSTSLSAPGKGIADNLLDSCQVLIWWGHVRQAEITPEEGRAIVARIKRGQLSLIALHSAHWSTPFVEAMNERARMDARNAFPATNGEKVEFEEIAPPRQYTVPQRGAPLTPRATARKFTNGVTRVSIHLPFCCFPAYRPDGKPSTIYTLLKEHPIARGLPATFQLPSTEMYDEPHHVPSPDQVVFEERWPTGDWFRSGCVWQLGKGKVFYFRPGHETYPVYKQAHALKVIDNAVRWLATDKKPVR